MNSVRVDRVRRLLLAAVLPLAAGLSVAQSNSFNSGSTGTDGALSPTADVTLTMPANGVFNFTTVNIPVNVTVRFRKNAANTPVVILARGDIVISGWIDVSGQSAPSASAGTSVIANFGAGGPGGFDGGTGGNPQFDKFGSSGQGPGGGFGGANVPTSCDGGWSQGGGGAGYSTAGGPGRCNNGTGTGSAGAGGVAYGSSLLQPLIGGSGGGGGAGSASGNGPGAGGGGGGGAILIVSSTGINFEGIIFANGGNSGDVGCCFELTSDSASPGGGGSGGTIRLVGPVVSGAGQMRVSGGAPNWPYTGGPGAPGRSRIDIASTGSFTYLSTLPSLVITSVGGVAAPAVPTGSGDISFPVGTASTQPVALRTTGVPPGTAVTLTVKPQHGAPTVSTSSQLAGTRESATATASIEVPPGVSTVMAVTSYTVTVAMGNALSVYAQNERVEKVFLSSELGGEGKVTLVTVSGKQFDAPMQALLMLRSGS